MPNFTAKKLSNPQLRHIYTLARELSLDNDELHGVVHSITGKEHISQLTVDEAIRVIDRLKGNMRGFKSYNDEFQQTPMLKKINALVYELRKYDKLPNKDISNKERLRPILKKYLHVDDIRFLNSRQHWIVIETLKKLIENEQRKLERSK